MTEENAVEAARESRRRAFDKFEKRQRYLAVEAALVVPICFVGAVVLAGMASPWGWPFFVVIMGWFVIRTWRP